MATGIGETLRAARHQRGRTIADAAAATRVRESYLAALEEDDFAALGGDVYVKGFLRSYAKYLGLDPEPLLAAYRREHQEYDEAAAIAQTPVAPMRADRAPGVPLGALVAVGAVVLLGILFVLGLRGGGEEDPASDLADGPAAVEPQATAPAIVPTPQADAPAAPATETPTAAPSEAPTAGVTEPVIPPGEDVAVTLDVTGAVSWLRVTVDGEIVFEGEQSQGYSNTFTGDESVVVRIGDASAVSLTVNGQDLGPLGGPGEVVERTFEASGPTTAPLAPSESP